MDQLTSTEKDELRAEGKEVPPTPEIPDSDSEGEENDDEESVNPTTEQETECIDLTVGGDDLPINPLTIPDPAEEEKKKMLAVKVKQERIDKNRAEDEAVGQSAQPVTSEGIFSGCESIQKI